MGPDSGTAQIADIARSVTLFITSHFQDHMHTFSICSFPFGPSSRDLTRCHHDGFLLKPLRLQSFSSLTSSLLYQLAYGLYQADHLKAAGENPSGNYLGALSLGSLDVRKKCPKVRMAKGGRRPASISWADTSTYLTRFLSIPLWSPRSNSCQEVSISERPPRSSTLASESDLSMRQAMCEPLVIIRKAACFT